MIAFDYSAGQIAPTALRAAGATAVFRYVSTPGNPKNITKSEYAVLTAAGIEVGLVFETTATWMLGGYGAGVAAARSARSQAAAVGYPADHPLWFAADFDTAARLGSVATVIDCLHGCADAEGSKTLVRAYGDYAVIEAAFTAGFTGGWQTVAWSGGIWSAHALIRQTGRTTTEAGVQVDIDEDAGPLFPPAATAPIAAPATDSKEETMRIIHVKGSSRIYAMSGGLLWLVQDEANREAWVSSGAAQVTVDDREIAAMLAAAGQKSAA